MPPPDLVAARQVDEAQTTVAAAEMRAQEATNVAAEAEAARPTAVATGADLERRVAASEATQEDLDRARRRCRVTGYESHLVTGQSEPAVAAVP